MCKDVVGVGVSGGVLTVAVGVTDETGVGDIRQRGGVSDGNGVGRRGGGVGGGSVEPDATRGRGDGGDGRGARAVWGVGIGAGGTDIVRGDVVGVGEQRDVQDAGRGIQDIAGGIDGGGAGGEHEHGSVVRECVFARTCEQ